MNNVDKEYLRLVDSVIKNGRKKKNRTGIDTVGVFGEQAKYKISLNSFPVLTTKKVHWPAVVHELLWFISGNTNIKYLVDNNVKIWNEWAYSKYKKWMENGGHISIYGHRKEGRRSSTPYSQEEFIQKIKSDEDFALTFGELGEGSYGGVWRSFPYHDDSLGDLKVGSVDQLKVAIDKLKTNPNDRRIIVNAWHPYWVEKCALPPCHVLYQFSTEELTDSERWSIALDRGIQHGITSIEEVNHSTSDQFGIPRYRLNCLLYQRSNDLMLGTPFNISSYCLLTAMIAHCLNMEPGTFTHSMGDTHIYVNHLDGAEIQLKREPKKLPRLWLNPKVKDLFSFKFDDIKLEEYDPHPAIKFQVAV